MYRGSAIPALQGAYVFADWTVNWAVPMGVVYYARPSADGNAWSMDALPLQGKKDGKIQGYVTAFGEDADGELYLLTNGLNGLSQRKGRSTSWRQCDWFQEYRIDIMKVGVLAIEFRPFCCYMGFD